MVDKRTRIVWDTIARENFKMALKFIKEDSPVAASRIETEILAIIEKNQEQPKRYPADKFRNNNDGSYRAFELYNLRFSYFIGTGEIRIVRVRSTHQKPLIF